ncbi:Organic cation/carnitine transporter 4 [Acorus calamus]|uniref:H(+)/Pi cotransporter n=1 Tax=Acorus calamus TaxID=4465 RepID=A0AAV9DSV7_ACOCL|nr:Organic cation/carnitine transporter 4 [Acorus calamus]
MVYYGLSLNVTNLNTNLHINIVLNAAAEVPAFALTMDRIGRKPLTIGTMWLAGEACLIGGALGPMKTAGMVCAVFGIFAMSGTFHLLGIYAAELFPTVVRNVALGCMSQSAQLGAILAPLVVVFGGAVPFAGVWRVRRFWGSDWVLLAGDEESGIVRDYGRLGG